MVNAASDALLARAFDSSCRTWIEELRVHVDGNVVVHDCF